MLTIINCIPYIDGELKKLSNITIDNGIIIDISNNILSENILDAKGQIASAGYIDIHTHGGFGKDCMEPTKTAIETICNYHLSTGITSFVPTTMTATLNEINNAIENISNFKSSSSRIIGIHLEGPFLSKQASGAHLPSLLKDPTDENSKFVFENKNIKRITIAPNLNNSDVFTKKAVDNGIQVSLGHDNSIDDEIYACIANGATSVTHMYNCTSRPTRRETPKKHLGLTEIGLISNKLICEIIADDRHVPNDLFNIIFKLKGRDGICLISDSLSVAGMPNGKYYIGSGESQQEIKIEDNVAVLEKANTYAGSITPISKMVASLFEYGLKKEDVIYMATLSPAKLLNLNDRGNIKIGYLGDINILDEKLNISHTILGGVIIK